MHILFPITAYRCPIFQSILFFEAYTLVLIFFYYKYIIQGETMQTELFYHGALYWNT